MTAEFIYFLDGQAHQLQMSSDKLVVRTRKLADGRRTAVYLPGEAETYTKRLVDAPVQGVAVFALEGEEKEILRGNLKKTYQQQPETAFAGRALQDTNSHEPVIYTENLFVQFQPTVRQSLQMAFFKDRKLEVKRKLAFAEGAYFLAPAPGIGTDIFELSTQLLDNEQIALCHPELLWAKNAKAMHTKQWHLGTTMAFGSLLNAHASVQAAHSMSTGKGVTIAVIDDGVEVNHAEFSAFGKCIQPFDFATRVPDARPKKASHAHGTNCAGVACAAGVEASGVAPDALLMPVVIPDFVGSIAEAEAIQWAAEKGADVISCSWGPKDGLYSRPNDPLHTTRHPIPDATRLAIDFAATKGRNGKGCVITWAAGNGNESVDLDGYASHPRVMAIGACNERSERSVYSDYGKAISCCFPSGDYNTPGKPDLLTKGLYVADRAGYAGLTAGAYTDAFSGTSAACPGVAGVAALVLSVAPNLTSTEVRKCIESTCSRIDAANGQYDLNGHSIYYGFGRVHAQLAVQMATAWQTAPGLQIVGILIAPSKGAKEAVEIRNLSNATVHTKVCGVCGKRQEWIDVHLEAGQTRLFSLLKLKLPNTKGTVVFKTEKGELIETLSWKKSQVQQDGWLRLG